MTRGAEIDDEPVRIVPYDPSWPSRFEAEKVLLEQAIGPWVTGGIHHVGSTSIPGLAAKPVIDILVGVEDLPSSRVCIEKLAELDYQYAPYRADEMHWFCKPDRSHRTHHLHLVPTGSRRYRAELAFRDALCAHPHLADDYARLKHALAEDFEHDREGYAQAKAAFIEKALREVPDHP
ncbi:MAG: GrpB family protein [Solirubrobacteraceae bacterium]